jgi:hypothetical protein
MSAVVFGNNNKTLFFHQVKGILVEAQEGEFSL